MIAWHCNEGHSHAVSNWCEFAHVWFSFVINYEQSTEDQQTIPNLHADVLIEVLEGEYTPLYEK